MSFYVENLDLGTPLRCRLVKNYMHVIYQWSIFVFFSSKNFSMTTNLYFQIDSTSCSSHVLELCFFPLFTYKAGRRASEIKVLQSKCSTIFFFNYFFRNLNFPLVFAFILAIFFNILSGSKNNNNLIIIQLQIFLYKLT